MKWLNDDGMRMVLVGFMVSVVAGSQNASATPIADAGLPRYAARDPVQLDGTGSYAPDTFNVLRYAWQQISGPSLVITDADTATPTVSGFVQTDEIQVCEFELVVSDVELRSRPDTVKVIIVPNFGQNLARHLNAPFDPDMPTFIFFGGGDCVTGPAGSPVPTPILRSRTNLIDFHDG